MLNFKARISIGTEEISFTGLLVIDARQAGGRTLQTVTLLGFPRRVEPPLRFTPSGSKKEGIPGQLQLCGLKSPVNVRGSEVSMGRLFEGHRRATYYSGAVVSTVASQ